jgi:hypothetical protein
MDRHEPGNLETATATAHRMQRPRRRVRMRGRLALGSHNHKEADKLGEGEGEAGGEAAMRWCRRRSCRLCLARPPFLRLHLRLRQQEEDTEGEEGPGEAARKDSHNVLLQEVASLEGS